MKNDAISFWQFLNENTIEIPILQRDYAQGRTGKEQLRKAFLQDLKTALDSRERLKLDFVYGMKEHGVLNPLDGQQRLTTLWLLHWFLAYQSKALKEDKNTAAVFRKFTYETRISSRDFCRQLVAFTEPPPNGAKLVDHIRNQTWFRYAWRHDPTIQAMLRMLGGDLDDGSDGISGVFGGEGCDNGNERLEGYWKALIEPNCPIVFYHLELHGLKQTDDLYVKMNARGKPLTSLENIKADLVGYINSRSVEKEADVAWKTLTDPTSGLAIKMDTDWADIFWQNRATDGTIDEIYFAFLNRFFFSELCLAKHDGHFTVIDREENENKSYRYFNDDVTIAYEGLDPYRIQGALIPLATLQKLVVILENYKWFSDELSKREKPVSEFINCSWNPGFCFIPTYEFDEKSSLVKNITDKAGTKVKKVQSINQVERVAFFAVSKFFFELDKESAKDFCKTKDRLKRWMRVVWNLVSCEANDGNPAIRSFDAMRRVMDFIAGLNSQRIYESLEELKTKNFTADGTVFSLQVDEEITKALKCKGNMDWEKKFTKAEQIAFFHGAIRFLFAGESRVENWDNFDIKQENAQQYFDEEGVSEKFRTDARLLRALLSRMGKIQEDFWFGNGRVFWRNQVLLNQNMASIVSSLLTTRNIEANPVSQDCNCDWICDNTLLNEAIAGDVKDGQWHIMDEWRGQKTLTRYSRRESRNVTAPWQIILLEHIRNTYLANKDEFYSEQRRGTHFFYGWSVDFKWMDHHFQWNEENKVYLLEEKNGEWLPVKPHTPVCVTERMGLEDFKEQLKTLIQSKAI